jgi:hypothetical protein
MGGRVVQCMLAIERAAAAEQGLRSDHGSRGRGARRAQLPDFPAGNPTAEFFDQHPDAQIYHSLPGLGTRTLAEFGDASHRYANAKARKNYAGTAPITRQSGELRLVTGRHARNQRFADAC